MLQLAEDVLRHVSDFLLQCDLSYTCSRFLRVLQGRHLCCAFRNGTDDLQAAVDTLVATPQHTLYSVCLWLSHCALHDSAAQVLAG